MRVWLAALLAVPAWGSGQQFVSPAAELSALQDLFVSTDGADWLWQGAAGHWNFTGSSQPCDPADLWQGLTCDCSPLGNTTSTATPSNASDVQNCTVTEIKLSNYNLQGLLPVTVSNLTNLIHLDLSFNSLVGSIPESLGSLARLQFLGLGDNAFSEFIPPTIGKLQALRELYLQENDLRGTVPSTLSDLGNLTLLSLAANFLSKALPASLRRLTMLHTLLLNNNRFTGTLPEQWSDLRALVKLYFYDNDVNGTIPSSYAQLQNLSYLEGSNNFLVGTLPSWLGELPRMIELSLEHNFFNGTIPESLGNLMLITTLYLETNELTGTIPDSFQNLRSLQSLYLNINNLHGTLPAWLGNLSALTDLVLYENRFSKTIPSSLGSLGKLNILDLSSNELTGQIPSSLSKLLLLQEFSLNNNNLMGYIPSWLGSLSNLSKIELNFNSLSGPIPASLGQLAVLSHLYLYNNALTGTIPQAVVNLNGLLWLYLQDNQLWGSLPPLSGGRRLQIFDVSGNAITGSIPASYAALPSLDQFIVFGNRLTGTIPPALFQIITLNALELNSNILSGTIPEFNANASYNLQNLFLSSNALTGPIPKSIAKLEMLVTLQLQDNSLHDTLEGRFNHTLQQSLNVIQVSDNHLTGTIPANIFQLPNLAVLAVVENCLTGPLPTSICDSQKLTSLLLDGLQSATVCIIPMFAGATSLSNAYISYFDFQQGVFPCIFALPTLTTLHASGIGIMGTLPSSLVLSPSLNDLDLSHNFYTGTIPSVIQHQRWTNLDLSYNRLKGLLSGNISYFGTNASLSLQGNRLSGEIPSSLKDVRSITILDGNLFACDLRGSSLPRHDNDRDTYECGSNAFDVPFYFWVTVIGVFAFMIVLVWFPLFGLATVLHQHVRQWMAVFDANQGQVQEQQTLGGVVKLGAFLESLRRLFFLLTAYILVVLLPIYIALSAHYGTFTYQYMWTASAGYIAGVVPCAIFMVMLILFVCIFIVLFRRYVPEGQSSLPQQSESAETSSTAASQSGRSEYFIRLMQMACWMVIFAFNAFVVVVVNIGFVIVSLKSTYEGVFFAQIALAIFKYLWNNTILRSVARSIRSTLFSAYFPHSATNLGHISQLTASIVSVEILTSLINNIAIPCCVVAIIDPNCYYNMFVAAPSVTATYQYEECSPFDIEPGECTALETSTSTTSYFPPFAYSYQCTASIIQYYAPAFMYLCILVSFFLPAAELGLYWLYENRKKKNQVAVEVTPSAEGADGGGGGSDTSTTATLVGQSRWFKWLENAVPAVLKTPTPVSLPFDALNTTAVLYFDAARVALMVFSLLGLLLTFGTLFPPLGVAITATMLMYTYYTQLKVGRFVLMATAEHAWQNMEILAAQSECFLEYPLPKQLWTMVTLSSFYFAAVAFDTLGDAVDFHRSYWVGIFFGFLPLALYLGYSAWRRLFQKPGGKEQPKEIALSEYHSDLDVKDIKQQENPMHNP